MSRGQRWQGRGGSSTSAVATAPGGSPRRWDGTLIWFVYFCQHLFMFTSIYLCLPLFKQDSSHGDLQPFHCPFEGCTECFSNKSGVLQHMEFRDFIQLNFIKFFYKISQNYQLTFSQGWHIHNFGTGHPN